MRVLEVKICDFKYSFLILLSEIFGDSFLTKYQDLIK